MLDTLLEKFYLVMLFKDKVSRLAKNSLPLLTGKVAYSKHARCIQQFIQSS